MKVVVLLCAVAVAGALPMAKEDGAAERFISALKDCLDTDTSLCLKVCCAVQWNVTVFCDGLRIPEVKQALSLTVLLSILKLKDFEK